jgi:clumping factor A
MKQHWMRTSCLGIGMLTLTGVALAAPKLRVQVSQKGDFLLIGNTLGQDCRKDITLPAPVGGDDAGTGDIGNCGTMNLVDSAPDVFWRSDDPAAGEALADIAVTPAQARSTAVLNLPVGAKVTHAFLYWGARLEGMSADTTATIERPGISMISNVTAIESYTVDATAADAGLNYIFYQSVADVTKIVQNAGSGAYRVSGVDSWDFRNKYEAVSFIGWYMVVFYQLDSELPRSLTLFDGLDFVQDAATSQSATLTGFSVPNSGFDAKLGIVTFEGDVDLDGDSIRFGIAPLGDADRLSDAQNPVNNFFNSTRSWLGRPVSAVGDLPQLTGTPGSMSSLDFDVVDITSRVRAGQTTANIQATTNLDQYLLAAFISSVSTIGPDFSSSTKTAADVRGGSAVPGDIIEYRINAVNTGSDTSIGTVLTDVLPDGVTYVPGSIQVVSGADAGAGAKTDAAGDDQAEYTDSTRTVTVRLGEGANATNGGQMAPGEQEVVSFRVTLNPGTNGTISNQAIIAAAGLQGSLATTTETDSNKDIPGQQPTEVQVGPAVAAGGGCRCSMPRAAQGTLTTLGLLGLGAAALVRRRRRS